ncbi:MAG: diguanylate cyclase domain-containing protein, partial [Acidobacteriota bacterium]
MFGATNLLRAYTRAMRRLTGAGSVSLFVPASTSGLSNAILIHDGEVPPVPELVDVDTAHQFFRTVEPRLVEKKGESLFSDAVPSTSPEGTLIRVPTIHSILVLTCVHEAAGAERSMARRKTDRGPDYPSPTPPAWIGLRFNSEGGRLTEAKTTAPLLLAPDEPEDARAWWPWLLALGGALAWHTQQVSSMLDDPVTGLPGRTELQASLAQAMDGAIARRSQFTLMLLNPEDFTVVNERFGNEAGDSVLREIGHRLRCSVRNSDLVSKYGGAVFAAILPDTTLAEGKRVAEKVLLALAGGAYLSGAVRLTFSVGIASFDPVERAVEQPLELIRRADQALNAAKRSGGGRIVAWWPGSEVEEVGNLDRLSGIFTANIAKDYRNMVLLWDAVKVVAGSDDFQGLAAQVVERVFSDLKPNQVGLFRWSGSDKLRLIHGLVRRPHTAGPPERADSLALTDEQRSLLEEARREARALKASLSVIEGDGGEEKRAAYAIPLIVGADCLGCLYLDGPEGSLALDGSDLIFLKALASQLAVALDRARLAEQERRRLRSELNELRQALQQSKFVYCSAQMDTVLDTVRRVAPTEATVLMTGESGTGKELLARTIHELSPRRKKPFVIVDCSAIAASL